MDGARVCRHRFFFSLFLGVSSFFLVGHQTLGVVARVGINVCTLEQRVNPVAAADAKAFGYWKMDHARVEFAVVHQLADGRLLTSHSWTLNLGLAPVQGTFAPRRADASSVLGLENADSW